ncbi:MAG: CobW family GTP-binding protein [Clostridia bacterium]
MIKVDVISGFLGSGKTTLIRKLLKAYESEKVVLIENEFGEIGIDGDVIERDGFEVFEISSGCICCIMQKDFVNLLSRVISDFKPERIIIEPTGISILSDIIDILRRPEFAEKCSINSLITVVDSMNYLEQCEVFGEFFEDQIVNASTLVLSKSQFVDKAKIDEITSSLRKLNAEADILTADWSAMKTEDFYRLLNGDITADFQGIVHAEYRPCRENEFDTFAIESSNKYTTEELESILSELSNVRYGQVIRGKGFLRGHDCCLEFSYTNGRFIVDENKLKLSGKLCLIGNGLKETELKELFKVKSGGLRRWLKY